MKKMIRFISLLMLLILCLSACVEEAPDANDPQDSTESTDSAESTDSLDSDNKDTEETEKPVAALAAADAVIVADNKKTGYSIIIDNGASKKVENIVTAFASKFATKTGANLKVNDDGAAPSDKEILIYKMDGRAESETVYNRITAPEKKGYRIEVINGSKIVVTAGDEIFLEAALDLLCDAIRKCDNGAYGIEKTYEGLMDIPAPAVGPTGNITTTYTGQGNYTVAVNKATKANYTTFTKALKSAGFSTYTTNKIGDVQFGTYYIDSQFGQVAVYTRYSPTDSCYKVTYGPLGYLPALRAQALTSEKVTPSITQMKITAGAGGDNAPGMSMVVQCEDGSYIVFDGGSYSADDRNTLYNFLVKNKPNEGNPIIAAWVITHAHGDHMGMANKFLEEYKGKIDLNMAVYNFPDWDNISLSYEGTTAGSKGIAEKFVKVVSENYPNAKHWISHTGEVMKFPGVEMTVLYNSEEYATGIGMMKNGEIVFGSANNTNVITRLDINGTTIMMLGDSMPSENKWMAENYGDAIKSDMLQLAHHGSNGGEITLYKTIDPDICIWPVEEERMVKFMTNSEFNRYLASVQEFAGGREREHFSHDKITTFECTAKGPVVKK